MKHESNLKPKNKYEIENIRNNRCEVVFFDLDSIEEEKNINENNEEETLYKYNCYRQSMSYNANLNDYINNNYAELLASAKNNEYDRLAKEIRNKRNVLLEETDKEMAFDRLGLNLDFNIPDNLKLTNIIIFIKELASALKEFGNLFKTINNSNIAKYRQELRDITKQENFPYNVQFPTKPDSNRGEKN